MSGVKAFVGSAAAVFVIGAASSAHASASGPPGKAARKAIAYAEAQIGRPYQWGGTGPGAFDCSGLVWQAYRHAGISIPRTSQEQWAAGRKIPASQVRPGDLAFFVGSDGTPSAPGHVALVISRHGEIVEAYATGVPIRYSTDHRSGLVGFTRPSGGA